MGGAVITVWCRNIVAYARRLTQDLEEREEVHVRIDSRALTPRSFASGLFG